MREKRENKGEMAHLIKESRAFSLEQAFLSKKDQIVICLLALLITLGRQVLYIPIWAEWKLTVEQDTTLFSVFVLLEVIAVCVIAFIPVLLVLSFFFMWQLKKNIAKLQEAMQKRGISPYHQKVSDKKEERESANNHLIEFLRIAFILVVLWAAFFTVLIVALYYSVFKQAKMFFQLQKELKSL
ncbi:hypothetical protein [Bartonella acomydis]